MRRLDIDARIASIAARQACVVHARDLREAGIGRGSVGRRLRSGSMAQVLPRTYVVGPTCRRPSDETLCMAGVLHAGAGAAVDGVTAARLRDAWNRPGDTIHVTSPGFVVAEDRRFAFHRRADLDGPGIARIGHVPITSFVDMCILLAMSLAPWQLAFVIDRGIYQRAVRIEQLDRVVAERAGVPWVGVLRAAIRLVREGSSGTRCGTEDHAVDGLLRKGIHLPTINTRGIMGIPNDEPDFVWRAQRLNVEIDGGHHETPLQREHDRRRDALAVSLGWRVLRFWWRDVWTRHDAVIGGIGSVLAGAPVSSISIRRVLDDEH